MRFDHTKSFKQLFAPSENIFARTEDSVEEYSTISGLKIKEIDLAKYNIVNLSFSADGKRLYFFANVTSEEEYITWKKFITWDLEKNELISELKLEVDEIVSGLVFSDEKTIAVGQHVRLYLFNIENVESLKNEEFKSFHIFRSHKTKITSLASTSDNTRLFSADENSIIKCYDVAKKEEIGGFELTGSIILMQISSCNDYLFVAAGGVLNIFSIKRMLKIHTIKDFNSSKIIFTKNKKDFIYHDSGSLIIRDFNTFELVSVISISHYIDEFIISSDESLCIITNGLESTVLANPLNCNQISIFGNSDQMYEYIDYVHGIMHSNANHDPGFDTWSIEPFHINALHLYAYYNNPLLLSQAVTQVSPFYPSRTGHTPLEISLEKSFMDCVESIFKALKLRIVGGDERAFYYIGSSLISLNNSGFENLHRIYELALRKCNDPTLPNYCMENLALPYGVAAESQIVDPIEFGSQYFVEEGTAIVFAKTAFRISMKLGSQDSTELLESIINCPNENIYSTTIVQMILKEKWSQVKWFFVIQTVIYLAYLVLLALYALEYYNDKAVLACPFLVSMVLFAYEIAQMYCTGLKYLSDPWNYVDMLRGMLLLAYSMLVWFSDFRVGRNPENLENEIFSLLVLLSWTKGITYFRVFEKTRYLIKLIMEATVDIIAFFVILFYSTIAFTFIYQGQHNHDDETLGDHFAESFKLNLGDLDDVGDQWIAWILFIVISIINPILMLNLLISIMGDTYGRVKESSIVADSRELASMILEIESIMIWRKYQNEEFFIKIICEDSYLEIEDDTPLGKVKSLRDKVKGLIEIVAQTKKDIIDSIYSSKQSILNSL